MFNMEYLPQNTAINYQNKHRTKHTSYFTLRINHNKNNKHLKPP